MEHQWQEKTDWRSVVESSIMHKRNIHRKTDSARRTERASQARLEELSVKIEREKDKVIRASHHEKSKVLNDLKSIHRVFKPRLGVIRENQNGILQIEENAAGGTDNNDMAESVKQPISPGRSETPATRRRHTEPNMWRSCGERMPAIVENHRRDDSGYAAPHAYKWSHRLDQSPTIGAGGPRLSIQIEREYLAKLRNAAEKPCISSSMSSVSMGYLAFKRTLKSKRQTECLDRKFVDPRFRSIFLDAAELSVIPEQMDWTAKMHNSVNPPYLVKKERSPTCSFNGRLPTPIRKHCSSTSLSIPMAHHQMSWREGRRNMFSSDLLCPRGTDILCSEISPKQRSELKTERSKTNRASGNYKWERSSFFEPSEDEEMFAKFDKNPREKLLLSDKNTGFLGRSSKVLRPLWPTCFSKSFQAVSQIEKWK